MAKCWHTPAQSACPAGAKDMPGNADGLRCFFAAAQQPLRNRFAIALLSLSSI